MLQTNNIKSGSCPHGLPQGACPICSGMGGGLKKTDFSARPGEMSWNECAAIGAFLRAQKNARIQRLQDAENFSNMQKSFDASIVSQKLLNISKFFVKNTPLIISKPIGFVLKTFIFNPIRFVMNLPVLFQKFADISDKLTAIMGELKNSIEKKISEIFANKKVKSIFSIIKPLNTDEKQIEETKKTFKLKTFIHDLYKKITKKEDR